MPQKTKKKNEETPSSDLEKKSLCRTGTTSMECKRVTLHKGLPGPWCVCCAHACVYMYTTCICTCMCMYSTYVCTVSAYVPYVHCTLYMCVHCAYTLRELFMYTHIVCMRPCGYKLYVYHMYMHVCTLHAYILHTYGLTLCALSIYVLYVYYVHCIYAPYGYIICIYSV